jgi:hypothetical protein
MFPTDYPPYPPGLLLLLPDGGRLVIHDMLLTNSTNEQERVE